MPNPVTTASSIAFLKSLYPSGKYPPEIDKLTNRFVNYYISICDLEFRNDFERDVFIIEITINGMIGLFYRKYEVPLKYLGVQFDYPNTFDVEIYQRLLVQEYQIECLKAHMQWIADANNNVNTERDE